MSWIRGVGLRDIDLVVRTFLRIRTACLPLSSSSPSLVAVVVQP